MGSQKRIDDLVRDVAARTPGAEAVVVGGQRWSYRELTGRIDNLAKALIAAGVGHGDRVACLSTPHPDFLVSLMAVASIGAIWVGLNPRYRPNEMAYVLADAEPKAILARTKLDGRSYVDDLAALVAGCPSLEAVVVLGGDPLFDGAMAYDAFIAAAEDVGAGVLDAARASAGKCSLMSRCRRCFSFGHGSGK